MMSLLRSLIVLVLIATVVRNAPGADGTLIWHSDYGTAVQEAKASGKKLLIVFTGTDWIDICRVFYDEILAHPDFILPVTERFTMLKLEYPKDNKLPREEAIQKGLLKDAYRVRGYPTVVMTETEGRPFGLNGYQPIPASDYADQILGFEAGHSASLEAAKEAESLEGVPRAIRLSESIPDLPGSLTARYYRKEMEEILANDPGDTLGFAASFRSFIADVDYSRDMEALSRESKWAEMLALTERYILENRLEARSLQKALLNKAEVQHLLENREGTMASLKQIVEIDADSDIGMEAQVQLKRFEEKNPGGGNE